MIQELRKKSKRSNSEVMVEWVGVENPEEIRLYEALQDAMDEDSLASTSNDPIKIIEKDNEELIDRVDEIDGKEIIHMAKPSDDFDKAMLVQNAPLYMHKKLYLEARQLGFEVK